MTVVSQEQRQMYCNSLVRKSTRTVADQKAYESFWKPNLADVRSENAQMGSFGRQWQTTQFVVWDGGIVVWDALIHLISRFTSGERGENFPEQPTLKVPQRGSRCGLLRVPFCLFLFSLLAVYVCTLQGCLSISLSLLLTSNNTRDFGHETFDSSDGHTLCLILDVSDNVFNLQRGQKEGQRQGKGDLVKMTWIRLKLEYYLFGTSHNWRTD